jgi:hypothetical protein
MPLYDYQNQAGERRELFRPIHQRDDAPMGFWRVLSVSHRGRFTGKQADPTTADAAVPRAFKQLEQTLPREQIEKQSGFSVRELKQTWNFA